MVDTWLLKYFWDVYTLIRPVTNGIYSKSLHNSCLYMTSNIIDDPSGKNKIISWNYFSHKNYRFGQKLHELAERWSFHINIYIFSFRWFHFLGAEIVCLCRDLLYVYGTYNWFLLVKRRNRYEIRVLVSIPNNSMYHEKYGLNVRWTIFCHIKIFPTLLP